MKYFKLTKSDEEFLENYRTKKGFSWSEAQKEAAIDWIIRGRTLELDPVEIFGHPKRIPVANINDIWEYNNLYLTLLEKDN